MKEIKLDLLSLESAVSRLRAMKEEWSANDTTPPDLVGGGKVTNELEALAQLYKDLNDKMVKLAANTEAFLSGMHDSYQESDHKAAKNIKGN